MEVPASVASGASLDVSKLQGPYEVQFSGIVSSTHTVETSHDGVRFDPAATIAANCTVIVYASPRKIRIGTTIYGSGAPTAVLATVNGR